MDTHRKKRLYESPRLEKVSLVIDEAVLKGCKGQTGFGPRSLNYCMDSAHGEINRACRGHARS